jgi:GNAT superfamily N-acetyltransferase
MVQEGGEYERHHWFSAFRSRKQRGVFMPINPSGRADWLEWAVDQVHPQLKIWYPQSQLESNLSNQLERDLDWLENLGEGFERNMPIAGATPAMYNHRVLEVARMQVMLGIRFRGGDISIPFVDLVRSSQAITSAAQVEAICDLVRQEFAIFKALMVRFYQPTHLGFQFNLPGSSGDKRVLAAPLTTMLEHPKPEGLERVSLRRANDLEFYPRYAETYAAIYQERPWLPHEAEPESLEDMQEHLETGDVFEIFVDGQWAGVTGAEHRSDEFALQGFVVIEMLLAKFARGQGLGAAVQYRLAEALQSSSSPEDVLYGTIGSNNSPMLKTAARVRRVDLGGWIWVNLT